MECNYNREYLTKNYMCLNRRGKGLVSKQLASEIWNLSAAEEMPQINLGWKTVQEQIVSNFALIPETRKVFMDELKIVPVVVVVVL
jgi:hypothetical protein